VPSVGFDEIKIYKNPSNFHFQFSSNAFTLRTLFYTILKRPMGRKDLSYISTVYIFKSVSTGRLKKIMGLLN